MNKYYKIGLIVVLVAVVVLGVYFFMNRNNEENTQTEFTYLPEVTIDQIEAKINAGETFSLFVGRPDCSDSIRFQEDFKRMFVEEIDEDNYNVLYDLDQPEKNFFYFNSKTLIPDLKDVDKRVENKEKYGFYFTPTLIHYEDTNEDGISEPTLIAEWDPLYDFHVADYMKWFYDTGLIVVNDEVNHDGPSDQGQN